MAPSRQSEAWPPAAPTQGSVVQGGEMAVSGRFLCAQRPPYSLRRQRRAASSNNREPPLGHHTEGICWSRPPICRRRSPRNAWVTALNGMEPGELSPKDGMCCAEFRYRESHFSTAGSAVYSHFGRKVRPDLGRMAPDVQRPAVQSALKKSRYILAMLEIGISFGQTASHSPSLEQLPNPSASA